MWCIANGRRDDRRLSGWTLPFCPCHESVEVSGSISSSIAELTGLTAGTPVVGGGGDQAASAVGNGIAELGVVSCTLGTSGVVFAHMEQNRSIRWDACTPSVTPCRANGVMGVTQGAGLSLQWFRNSFPVERL
jgi:xylulokinase